MATLLPSFDVSGTPNLVCSGSSDHIFVVCAVGFWPLGPVAPYRLTRTVWEERNGGEMRDGTLNGKYIVERTDGQHRPDSRYFVLNWADPYARIALGAYADACAVTHPTLSSDLVETIGYHDARDKAKRKDTSKPVRGAQGSAGVPATDEALLDVVRRHIAADPEFAVRLADTLAS